MCHPNMDHLLKLLGFLLIVQFLNAHGFDHVHPIAGHQSPHNRERFIFGDDDDDFDDGDFDDDDFDDDDFDDDDSYELILGTLTKSGRECIFPFFHEGVRYNSCVQGRNRPHPWCATSIYNNHVLKTWEVCSPPRTLTKSGRECIFPFFHEGVRYDSCVQGRDHPHPWCATSIYNNHVPKTWEVCSPPTVCPGGCGNGQCTSFNMCTCSNGYTGNTCDIPVCPGGCGNGRCTSPNMCTCSNGYEGMTCDTLLCPSPWFRVGNQCFGVVSKESEWRTWTAARTYCGVYVPGADLAQPNDIKALADNMVDNGYADMYWLGGSAWSTDGVWRWNNGDTITNGWRQGEPSDGDDLGRAEDCVEMRPVFGANSLNNWRCGVKASFICERIF